jgi:hypothetical protein
MRQGLEPEFDFTAQFVLEVNDLFLHYAATSVLAIELYQSLGVECALVARTDAPLRELLQGRRGKLVKHAQLYSVSEPSGASGAPQVVGTLVYEMRMRKKIDAPVHSFMQRFPDVATLALMPVRPGARTSEAIVTVRRASGLRLRAGGAGPPAPYVHFEFFEYGEHETVAKEGSHPTYEQEFRFPVERDGDFIEYLKQAKLRLNVFDENEEDTEAMIGYAELGLTPLPACKCSPRRPLYAELGLTPLPACKCSPRRPLLFTGTRSSGSRRCSRRRASMRPSCRCSTCAAAPRARSTLPSSCATRRSRSRSHSVPAHPLSWPAPPMRPPPRSRRATAAT